MSQIARKFKHKTKFVCELCENVFPITKRQEFVASISFGSCNSGARHMGECCAECFKKHCITEGWNKGDLKGVKYA